MRRQTLQSWSIQGGVVNGHYHQGSFRNGHDAVAFGVIPEANAMFGLVADGCGSGEHSEVGAKLAVKYASRSIYALSKKEWPTIERLPSYIFSSLVNFLRIQANLLCSNEEDPIELALTVQDYLLFTFLGFYQCLKTQRGVFFRCGDGHFITTHEHRNLDEKNTPSYIGYNCIQDPTNEIMPNKECIPNEFDLYSYSTEANKRIMIATDGLLTTHGNTLKPPIDDLPWGHKGKVGFKLWMNRMHNQGYFEDDCAIVVAESEG